MNGFSKFLLVCLLVISALSAKAQDQKVFSKEDVPCLSGVCLGDPVSKHAQSIQWYEVRLLPDPSEKALSYVDSLIKNISARSRRIVAQYIDRSTSLGGSEVVDLSKGGTRFCKYMEFSSSFDSRSGYRTDVGFRTEGDGTLRVYQINRRFPASSAVESESNFHMVRKVFPYIDRQGYYEPNMPWGGSMGYGSNSLSFGLKQVWKEQVTANLARHPSCKPTGPASVD